MSESETPIIYNLFPRLAGRMDRWPEHAARAARMGFNWVFINPIQYPGFSGSLYAVKDYYRLNPDFLPEPAQGPAFEVLRRTLQEVAAAGPRPMLDLVINHTARDSTLVEEHPDWYVRDENGEIQSPFAVDPDDPSRITVWGDLAEIDNAGSPDRPALWAYWAGVVERYLELGFAGFRCDAAYKVPAELWRYLVEAARRVRPDAVFFAETLGCTLEEARALRGSGLDFFFNSSKWWDFQQPWCLEQHHAFADIPSISFSETHDTERLATETGGNQAVQRQRYAFAATFSAGLMMPIGYEYGFRRKLDVVHTRPGDWEEPAFNLEPFVTRVNRLKLALPLLHGNGTLNAMTALTEEVLVLERRAAADAEVGWIAINKRVDATRPLPLAVLPPDASNPRVFRLCRDDAPEVGEPLGPGLTLDPAEVVLIVGHGTQR